VSSKRTGNELSRREFVRISVTAAAAATAVSQVLAASDATSKAGKPLPMRPLGKTGVKVTVLNLGTGGGTNRRLLDYAYARGIRYFDTADCYDGGRSEREIAKWFKRTGKRKEIFLVTKDHPRKSQGQGDVKILLQLIDKRLEALETDYIDLFFIHGISVKQYGPQALKWPKSGEFKEVCERLRKSGKVRFVGFSCHDPQAPEFLMAAAEGGFVDAIMVSYNPVLTRPDDRLNRALDACHKAGIGLIAMKTVRGMKGHVKPIPEKDLNFYQAVIQAVLSDERITSICSAMRSYRQIDQNTAAARRFKAPLSSAEIERIRSVALAAGVTYCPHCGAECRQAAGTKAELDEVLRYLSYYEQDGQRDLARRLYRALPPQARDWSDADLAAASRACPCGIDFASLLKRAAEKLA